MMYLHFNQILNPVGTTRKEDAKEFTVTRRLVGSYLDWLMKLDEYHLILE